jgi:hypothetical protein
MMKNIRHILILSSSVILIFFSIIYSSCHKDLCKGVVCVNGGKCIRGICDCPSGYAGDRCEATTVVYYNKTLTPLTITVNSVTKTIGVKDSFPFYGTPGSVISGGAYAVGEPSPGKWAGVKVTWDLNDSFPQKGLKNVNINVPKQYYFLKIQNLSRSKIVMERFTAGDNYEDIENFTIPVRRDTVNFGYFPTSFPPYIYFYDSTGAIVFKNRVSITGTNNINLYSICGIY